MEPTPEIKRSILQNLIEQFEQKKYMQETMGKTWQTIGNAKAAEACAKEITEATMAIAELNKQLEAIPATDPS